MCGGPAKKFHGVGIGPLSNILAVKLYTFLIISGKLKGPDPLFKTVAAIATLVKLDSDVKALTEALEVKTELAKIPKGRMARLDECVTECLTLLN